MPDEFLTITQVAALLLVRERVVSRLIKAGLIPSLHVGKAIRVRRVDVEAWAEANLLKNHPVTMTVGRSVAKGNQEGSANTSEPVVSLVRGPKGRNRERLAKGAGDM